MGSASSAHLGDDRLRRVASPAPRHVWRDLLTKDENAVFFHDPDWVDQVCDVGGYEDVSRLYETRQGHLILLPLVRKTYLKGTLLRQGSLPEGWGTGGLLAGAPVGRADVAAILEDLQRDRRVLRTLIQPGPLTHSAWNLHERPGAKPIPRRAHVLDLRGGFDDVWSSRFAGTARTAVRKAE